MLDPEPLIIIGSSVRAAAQSAVHAGFRPWCIDQFGDRDLTAISPNVHTVRDWPNEIESVIQSFPQADWVYTGALENRPVLIERLSQLRPLCGCNLETLSRLRDPLWIVDTLTKASLPCLPVIVPDSDNPVSSSTESGEWVIKPLASAAGIGVRDLSAGSAGTTSLDGNYLQQKARGRVISGLYLAVEDSTLLIGLCEQLCRGDDADGLHYVYSGSVGPLNTGDVPVGVFEQARKIALAIAARLRAEHIPLRGLIGIDFVLDAETDELWTLEINPRYTASVEIYERVFSWPLMQWHVAACRGQDSNAVELLDSRSFNGEWQVHGKLIVYAERDFAAPDIVPLVERLSANGVKESIIDVADIPQLKTPIRKDEPICTLLTAQENFATCRAMLTAGAHELLSLIHELAE
tara:strand:+ start:88329 stop:89549 length:1221 start_codon:yes stop_codon:yes gene_type:complete